MKNLFTFLLIVPIFLHAQDKKISKAIQSMDLNKIEVHKTNPKFQETIDYELIYSIHNENIEQTKLCLSLGANPNSKCTGCYNRDALQVALNYKNKAAYFEIKPLYIFSETIDELGQNLLFPAALNDIEILKDVVNTYHPKFVVDSEHENALHYAFDGDTLSSEKIDFLIQSYKLGAEEINILPNKDFTILTFAVFDKNMELTKKLVELGADPFLFKTDISAFYRDKDFIFSGSAFHISLSMEDTSFYNYFKELATNLYDEISFEFMFEGKKTVKNIEQSEMIFVSNAAFFLVGNPNAEFLEQFREYNIDYNVIENIWSLTPMLSAIDGNNLAGVNFILSNEWDQTYSKTALKWAKEKGVNPEIKIALEKYLADN